MGQIRHNIEYASVVWNNLTLADFNKFENVKRKIVKLCYYRFIQPNSFHNYKSMLNYLHFKNIYSRRQNLDALFLINVFKNEYCSVMGTVSLLYPLSKLETFPLVMSVLSQQGASRLQTSRHFQ
jgi:hypothetical protein